MRPDAQRGSVLVVAAFVLVAVIGLAAAWLAATVHATRAAVRSEQYLQQLFAADTGIANAVDQLNRRVLLLPNPGDTATLTGDAAPMAWNTTITRDAGGGCTLLACGYFADEAGLPASERHLRVLEAKADPVTVNAPTFNVKAAITADGPVQTLGNITVDGRDHDVNGALTGDPGTWGITSTSTIANGGSSTVGGNGLAPVQNNAGTNQQNYSFAGADDDGDAGVDEELPDGLDNDGDGLFDEDTNDFPATPDAFVGAAPGTLKAMAQASGTYFVTKAAYDAAVAANGNKIPGGVVVYLEFDTWGPPAEIGGVLNDPPSILVHHNATKTAVLKNLHGQFKGLLLADGVDKVNSGTQIIGAIASFAQAAPGNAFGNGNSDVKFSSAVLNLLPSVTPNLLRYRVISWRDLSETSFSTGPGNTSTAPQNYEGK